MNSLIALLASSAIIFVSLERTLSGKKQVTKTLRTGVRMEHSQTAARKALQDRQ